MPTTRDDRLRAPQGWHARRRNARPAARGARRPRAGGRRQPGLLLQLTATDDPMSRVASLVYFSQRVHVFPFVQHTRGQPQDVSGRILIHNMYLPYDA